MQEREKIWNEKNATEKPWVWISCKDKTSPKRSSLNFSHCLRTNEEAFMKLFLSFPLKRDSNCAILVGER